jgi:Holliday junction resolvasome RuvABC endonuclease subunit
LISERVLSLDLSTKTGFCLLVCSGDKFNLEAYGQLEKIPCPEEETYPGSYVTWAYKCYEKVEELIEKFAPDVLVIEEVTKSQNAFSQKILDYIHFLVAKFIQETGIKNVFFQTGEWRKEVGSYMNAAEKNLNKYIKEYKEKHGTKLARDPKTGKVIGRIDKKKVTIRLINDIFKEDLNAPLECSEDDTADAMALVWAYHLRRKRGMYV